MTEEWGEQVSLRDLGILSGKACQGILRRAERRGKDLPPVLKAVLLTQSESGEDAKEAEKEP